METTDTFDRFHHGYRSPGECHRDRRECTATRAAARSGGVDGVYGQFDLDRTAQQVEQQDHTLVGGHAFELADMVVEGAADTEALLAAVREEGYEVELTQ